MKIKTITVVLGMLLSILSIRAQDIKPLSIGDTVPDLVLHNVINYKDSVIRLSDFKDKLVILDFMNTGCSGCIAALPRIDSLVRLFENDITAFVSIPENKQKAISFKVHNPIGQKIGLAFITSDSLLEKYFPHVYISHIVWVYKGKVIAATHSDYVTQKNIKTVLSDAPIRWPVKTDVTDYDYESPLVTLNTEAIPEFSLPKTIGYSVFTSHLDNLPSRFTVWYDSLSNVTRVTAINQTLFQLYEKAFGLPPRHELSRLAPDEGIAEYFHNTGDGMGLTDWKIRYTFGYETLLRGRPSANTIREKLRKDIDIQFGLSASIKDSMVACWLLVYDSTAQKVPFDSFENYAAAVRGKEISVWSLIYTMNRTLFHAPVINEKNFGLQQYLKIDGGTPNDLNAVNRLLAPYGLSFREVLRQLPILTIQKIKTIPDPNKQNDND